MNRKKVISYYLHPEHFSNERAGELIRYFKLQIDLSLELGWQPSDLLFYTNVDFAYKDVVNLQFNSWLADPKKLLFNKYMCLNHVQQLYPDDLLFVCDHDTFQIRNLEWEKVEKFMIACVSVTPSYFQDNLCTFTPRSIPLIALYTSFLQQEYPFKARGFRRHQGAYSGELNQSVIFNENNGFDKKRDVLTTLKLLDRVMNGFKNSLDPSNRGLWEITLPDTTGYDALHIHLNDVIHRRIAMSNPLMRKVLT